MLNPGTSFFLELRFQHGIAHIFSGVQMFSFVVFLENFPKKVRWFALHRCIDLHKRLGIASHAGTARKKERKKEGKRGRERGRGGGGWKRC